MGPVKYRVRAVSIVLKSLSVWARAMVVVQTTASKREWSAKNERREVTKIPYGLWSGCLEYGTTISHVGGRFERAMFVKERGTVGNLSFATWVRSGVDGRRLWRPWITC